MTQAPATGLWGPGDYGPDFVTIDEVLAKKKSPMEFHVRNATVTALLDLAHDLDARGLVLMPEVATEAMLEAGSIGVFSGQECTFEDQAFLTFNRMIALGVTEFLPLPPDPNTGS